MIKLIYPNKYVSHLLLTVKSTKAGSEFGQVRHLGFGIWVRYKYINHVLPLSGIFIYTASEEPHEIEPNFIAYDSFYSLVKSLWRAKFN